MLLVIVFPVWSSRLRCCKWGQGRARLLDDDCKKHVTDETGVNIWVGSQIDSVGLELSFFGSDGGGGKLLGTSFNHERQRKHREAGGSEFSDLQCPNCELKFRTEHAFAEHKRQEHSQDTRCKWCRFFIPIAARSMDNLLSFRYIYLLDSRTWWGKSNCHPPTCLSTEPSTGLQLLLDLSLLSKLLELSLCIDTLRIQGQMQNEWADNSGTREFLSSPVLILWNSVLGLFPLINERCFCPL